jgi:hypothetical protein
MEPRQSLDLFFQKINRARAVPRAVHPSDRILRDFATRRLAISGELSDEHFEKLLKGTPERWTRTDVQAHLAICSRCANRLPQMKKPTGELIARLDSLSLRLPDWIFRPLVFRAHGLLYALVTVLLFVVPYATLNTTLRPHSPLNFLAQLLAGEPVWSWWGLGGLVLWGAWSLVALTHFLLLRYRGDTWS